MPLLGDPGHASLVASLRTRVPEILSPAAPSRPRAILLVTAHWSTPTPTISSGSSPSLLYDYSGFPAAAYSIKYPAPGSPSVAQEAHDALKAAGFAPELDGERGWDHGVFVPLKLAAPDADVPVVQVSVLASEDPAAHFRMGRALAGLRDKGVAILGSGSASFHNLKLMFSGGIKDAEFKKRQVNWDEALAEAVEEEGVEKREEKLAKWRDLPGSKEMHPVGGAEHFMPLLVCAGAAGDGVKAESFKDEFFGMQVSSFYWK